MDSVLYLFALIGIVIVVLWSVRNDRVPMNGRTRGLLAMREPEQAGTEGDNDPAEKRPESRHHPDR